MNDLNAKPAGDTLVLTRANMKILAPMIEKFRGYSGVFREPIAVITPLDTTYRLRSPLAISWLYDAASEYFAFGTTSTYRYRLHVAAAHEVEVERMVPVNAMNQIGRMNHSEAA